MVSQSLQLFLKLFSIGSFNQIIGFGSSFEKYDIEPKRNLKKNISETFKKISNLNANLGEADILPLLKYIYDSYKIYDKINFQDINIFN